MLFFWIFLVFPALGHAFEASLEPDTVKQGDPFVLHVTLENKNSGRMDAPNATFNGGELAFSPCGPGCFVSLAVVPLEAEPGEHPLEVSDGKVLRVLTLKVEDGSFPRQQLTLPKGKVTLSPEDEKRANREAAMLKALWPRAGRRLWEGDFIMPLDNSFSTAFGTKRIMNGTKKSVHSGLDIRGRMGEEVRAANDGRVVVAEELFFGGNTLVVDHGMGVYTVYMHLSKFNTSAGELVSRGEVIGFVGSTGRSTGPHLHYGVKINAENANPTAMTRLPLASIVGGQYNDTGGDTTGAGGPEEE